VKEAGGDRPDGGDERGPPRAEHDHRGDLDGAREPEAVGLDGSAQPLAIGVFEEPHEDRSSQEQSQGRMAHIRSIGRIASPA
jgi:hypothetical protein